MAKKLSQPAAVIILAAGAGTRMKSSIPKIMHHICGRTMIGHAITAAQEVEPRRLAVTVRHQRDMVAAHIADIASDAVIVDQDIIPGTGRAVEVSLAALDAIEREETGVGLDGTVVVTYADVPLLEPQQISDLIEAHEKVRPSATILTTILEDPTGYGRIVRDEAGLIEAIVEQKDATAEQAAIKEVNSGIYAFDAAVLRRALGQVTIANRQGEKYLTDVIRIIRKEGSTVTGFLTDDLWQVKGVNDRIQLSELTAELNQRILKKWMAEGVTVADTNTVWVGVDVTLESDVTLLPGVQLCGNTRVCHGATVGPDTTLSDVHVGEYARVVRTHASEAVIGARAMVGPFAYLRPGTRLGAEGKIGTFVETKNAEIGSGSKVPHLSYVGDATIGTNSNIGASSVFVNYDGVSKHHTVIGNDVRMGSDNMFVAPVVVGDGAYSGAGTVVRKDVPPGALALSTGDQRNVEGWVIEKRPGTAAAEAAARAKKQDKD